MLTSIGDGVWIESGPISFFGLRLTATMTVLLTDKGETLVHSPLPLTVERRTAVSRLGRVAHLYAPNTFHHLWLGEWAAVFPTARVHAPSRLAAKRADLRIDRFHDQADLAQVEGIDEIPIRGFRFRETVLVHRMSRTAVLADLVHNIGRPTHRWTKLYSQVMGFYDCVALGRDLRWMGFDDRAAARASVNTLLDRGFDNLVVGHGEPIVGNARDVLAAATARLPPIAVPRITAGSEPGR